MAKKKLELEFSFRKQKELKKMTGFDMLNFAKQQAKGEVKESDLLDKLCPNLEKLEEIVKLGDVAKLGIDYIMDNYRTMEIVEALMSGF